MELDFLGDASPKMDTRDQAGHEYNIKVAPSV